MSNLKFLIVIPHYGSNSHLQKLFPSLGVQLSPSELDELTVGECVVFPFKYGEVYVWNNNLINRGFTAACNEGIRYGMNNNYDVIWLLNNDTEIQDLGVLIEEATKEFESGGTTGIIGFKILSMEDPDFIHHAGTGPCFPAGVHKVGRVSMGQFELSTNECWVTGASMMIGAGCLLETGLLDEKMANYGSDSDFCFRARYHGFGVVYLPVPVLHKIGSSQNPTQQQARGIRHDMIVFDNKWRNGKTFHDLENEQMVSR
jgi:GT2 family glycosyltransferase